MYADYWKLADVPFVNQSDARFYFPSASHQAALLKLEYVRDHALGAGLLVGGSGAGKSFLISKLAQSAPESTPVVHLFYSPMSAAELLAYFAAELGSGDASQSSRDGSLDRILRGIEGQLAALAKEGRPPVLVVDEAHAIDDPAVWSALTLLLNYQQQPQYRFTLLLVGDRTLIAKVARQVHLETRVAAKAVVQPLTAPETGEYVRHRLGVVGCERDLFTGPALHSLFELSGGVPARVNRLCDLALLVGYAENLEVITEAEIEAVAHELTFAIPD